MDNVQWKMERDVSGERETEETFGTRKRREEEGQRGNEGQTTERKQEKDEQGCSEVETVQGGEWRKRTFSQF